MKRYLWNTVKAVVGTAGIALVACPGPARAEDSEIEALKARLDKLEKQNELLQRVIETGGLQATGAGAQVGQNKAEVEKIIADYLKAQEAAARAADAKHKAELDAKGYEVGGDLKMNVRWNRTSGVTFETPYKDFSLHVGGRFQLDQVWFDQSESLRPPPGAPAQIGDMQDGQFFRRVRIQMDGTAWEVVEFNLETALENAQNSIVGLDEYWVGVRYIPIVGAVRVGHQKVPQGFEGDMVSSSKAMTFLERAAYTDAFYQNFATGLWTGNSVWDEHLTWALMAYRQDRNPNGDDFADGEYGYSGRVTCLPLYEHEGRCLIHLGASATWRDGRRDTVTFDPPKIGDPIGTRRVQFRARPELRDASGDFGNAPLVGNSVRMVDTGALPADSATVLGTEFFSVWGPFSLQAEWAWATMNQATFGGVTKDRTFQGGYVQATYFLTGEHRAYDRRLGREGTAYLVGPITNAWAVRQDDGSCCCGWGAWELAARWSYLDLNDGDLQGGILDGWEFGVNWYLNPNLKVQFEYMTNHRRDKTTGGGGNNPGTVDGLGIRTQIFF